MNLIGNLFSGQYKAELLGNLFLRSDDAQLFNEFAGVTADKATWQKFTPGTVTYASACSAPTAANDTYTNIAATLVEYYKLENICKEDLRVTVQSLGFQDGDWSNEMQVALVNEKVAQHGENIYIERWVGNTSTGSRINGVYTLLDAATTNIDVVGATITSANVITELNKVVAAIPQRVRRNKGIKIVITPAIADALYQYWGSTAMTQLGTLTVFPEGEVFAKYMGIELVVIEALYSKPNTMIACVLDGSKNSAIGYAYDKQDGIAMFKQSAIGSKQYEFEFSFRAGLALLDPANIVFYKG